MNVMLPEATQAVYLEVLSDRSLDGVAFAIERIIRFWDRPGMMPPVALILQHMPRERDESEQRAQAEAIVREQAKRGKHITVDEAFTVMESWAM